MLIIPALMVGAHLATLIPPPVPPDPTAVITATAMLERHPPVRDVEAFLNTPAGKRFWMVVGPSQDAWSRCIYSPAREHLDIDGALNASGLPRLDQSPLAR